MDAQQQMIGLISSNWITQAVYVAAKLKIADHLKDGPRTADELAAVTHTHAPSLFRLLRLLAGKGLYVADDQHRFRCTPLGDCLRSDIPGSQWALALMNAEEQYRAWGELLYSIQTGNTGFEKVHGQPIFDYFAQRPESAAIFDQAMVSVHGAESEAMLNAYDFSTFPVLADLGGGNGSVLCAMLKKHRKLQGILFDLPHVVARAKSNIEQAGVADRCQLVPGSFFEAAPPGATAYFMRHILHDWYDERCHTILQNIHRVIPRTGKLLVCEHVIRNDNEDSPGKALDLTMLVIPGGKERTEHEYRQLFAAAGFRLDRVVPTAAEVCVLEASPV